MEKKQTAVDRLIQILIDRGFIAFPYTLPQSTLWNVVDEAKEMEKQQIKGSWLSAWKDSMLEPLEDKYYEPEAEQYYNEEYGGETMMTTGENNNPGNTTPTTYRKKPIEIEAVQFKGFDKESGQVILSERPEWLVSQFGRTVLFFGKPDTLTIKTLEGEHIASIGDWIIKGVKGEFYPCKPDVFEMTYEPC